MNPVPSTIGAASLPQVNLLPAEVGQRRARGRARLAVMGVAALMVLALAAAVFFAYGQKGNAQTRVDDLDARNLELQAKQASYNYVAEVRMRRDLAISARKYAGLYEVEWSPMLEQIREVLPKYLYLWKVELDFTTIDLVAAGETSAIAEEDLGALTMTLRSDYYIDAADVVDGIDSIPGLARTTVTGLQLIESEDTLVPDPYWIAAAEELEERNLVTEIVLPADLDLIEGTDVYYEMTLTTRIDLDALSLRFSEDWYAGLDDAAAAHTEEYRAAVAATKELRDAIIARARDVEAPTADASPDAGAASPTPTPEETN